jgi:hypothetical protein
MGSSAIRKYLSSIAKEGGKARAKALTPEERKAIATKASKAAAEVRKRKARMRQAKKAGEGM